MRRRNKKIKHPEYGHLTNHHLVPRSRIRNYYGASFKLPNNLMRLWRFRHNAWHVLFGTQTLNETIAYLKKEKHRVYAYEGKAWKVLFREKTWRQAMRLLLRAQRMIRNRYKDLEFDPSLKRKVHRILVTHQRIDSAVAYLNKRFKKPYRGPFLKVA